MSRVTDMHRLTEDLTHSYEERMAGVAQLRAGTASFLGETSAARAAMATEQRRELDEYRGALREGVSSFLHETHTARAAMAAEQRSALDQDRATRASEVAGFLRETHQGRAAMAAAQRDALASGHAELIADVTRFLRETRAGRATMAADQRKALDDGRTALATAVSSFLQGTRAERAAMAAEQRRALDESRSALAMEVSSFLAEADAAHTAMASAQRRALGQGREALRQGVSGDLEGFHANRMALRRNLAAFSQEWRDFAQMMGMRRAGAAPGVAPEVEAPPAPPPQVPMAEARPFVVEEAVEAVEIETHVAAAAPIPGALPSDDEIFSYLADHPDGVRLVELEEQFGVARIRLVSIINRLIDENRARKDEEHKLYFAT